MALWVGYVHSSAALRFVSGLHTAPRLQCITSFRNALGGKALRSLPVRFFSASQTEKESQDPAQQFFAKLDVNKDGVLDRTEIHVPQGLFDKLDVNKDGFIDRKEFVDGWKKYKSDIILGSEVVYPLDEKEAAAEEVAAQEQLKKKDAPAPESTQSKFGKMAPGLVACSVVYIGAIPVAESFGQGLLALQGISGTSPISAVPVAIVLGVIARSGLPPLLQKFHDPTDVVSLAQPGANFACSTLLRVGTICIGAKLSALDLVTVGLTGMPVVITSIGAGMVCIPLISKALGLPDRLGQLLSVGTSICGVSAISATAPVVKAERKEIAFAVANVVAFGTLGMLAAPYIAQSAFTHSEQVGIFLGLAAHDTAQVLGSALTYHTMHCDETAFQVAVVTKLMRNLCLAAIVPAMAISRAGKPISSLTYKDVRKLIPDFVLGFVALSAVRTVGDVTLAGSGSALCIMDAAQWKAVTNFIGGNAAATLLGVAMAGLGLTLSPNALKGVGVRPFAAGLLAAIVVGGTGLIGALLLPKVVTLGHPIDGNVTSGK